MNANPEIQVIRQQVARGAWLNRSEHNLNSTPEELEATTERLAKECAARQAEAGSQNVC